MPTPPEYKAPFRFGMHYHVTFKCHGGLKIFRQEINHNFFLARFFKYLNPVARCQAYCLIPNHTHKIIQVRDKEDLTEQVQRIPDHFRSVAMTRFLERPDEVERLDRLIESQFNYFMVSYVGSFNKLYQRKGGMFQNPFRRCLINDPEHHRKAIVYTHLNPQKHGLVEDFRSYEHSSYLQIAYGDATLLDIGPVLELFGGVDPFIRAHVKTEQPTTENLVNTPKSFTLFL